MHRLPATGGNSKTTGDLQPLIDCTKSHGMAGYGDGAASLIVTVTVDAGIDIVEA